LPSSVEQRPSCAPVEERAKTLRAELAEFDEQIASTERALADANAQRDRDHGGRIRLRRWLRQSSRAAPGFGASCRRGSWTPSQKRRGRQCRRRPGFSTQRECGCVGRFSRLRNLICWELRSARGAHAARGPTRISPSVCDSRTGATANSGDRSAINLHPSMRWVWRGGAVKYAELRRSRWLSCQKMFVAGRAAASACGLSECPACADPDSHSWQRRVSTASPRPDDPQLVDLDALCRRGEGERPSECCMRRVAGIQLSIVRGGISNNGGIAHDCAVSSVAKPKGDAAI